MILSSPTLLNSLITRARSLCLASLPAGLALLFAWTPVWAADGLIRDIRYDAANRHFLIDASGPVKAMVNTLKIAGHKRIIIDIDNAEIAMNLPRDAQLLESLVRQMPAIRNVTVNQYGGAGHPIVRILMDLQGDPGNIRLTHQGPQIELELSTGAGYEIPGRVAPPVQTAKTSVRPTSSNALANARPAASSGLDMPPSLPGLRNREISSPRVSPAPAGASVTSAGAPGMEDLKRALVEINRRYDRLNEENRALRAHIASEQTRTGTVIQDKQTEAETRRREAENLRSENGRLQKLVEQLRAEKNTEPASRPPLPSVAVNTTSPDAAALQTLRKQVTIAQQSLNDAIHTINEQNKEIAYLRNQVADVKAGLDVSAKEQIEHLQNTIAEKDAALQRLSAAKPAVPASTTSSTASVRAEADGLKRQLAVLTQQHQSDLESLNRQLQAKSVELTELRNQQAARGASSASANAEVDALKRQLAALMQQHQSELESLNHQVQAKSAELTELRKKQAARMESSPARPASAEMDSLKRQLATLTQQHQSELESLNRQLQARNTELAELRRKQSAQRAEPASSGADPTGTPRVSTIEEAAQDYRDGKAALTAKDLPKALDRLKEAHLLDPDRGQYAMDYSAALAENHQHAEAIDVLRRYLQQHSADREAYSQLGKIYLLSDQPEAANQAFRRAISTSLLNNYATSLKKLDKASDAESVFKLALQLNPKDSEVLFNLGNLYNAQNKPELARNQYLEALRLKPDFAEAHYNVGLLFSKLGDNAQAIQHLEKFLELSPNARNAETIRAYVQKLKAS